MEPEQRKNVRFLADDSAIIALRNRFTKIGKLKDISIGGLSFEHIYDEDMSQEPFGKDIFLLVENEFQLSKLPCKVVYDIPVDMPNEFQGFNIRLVTRRCGVQFEGLLGDQVTQLDCFIKAYTKGAAA